MIEKASLKLEIYLLPQIWMSVRLDLTRVIPKQTVTTLLVLTPVPVDGDTREMDKHVQG